MLIHLIQLGPLSSIFEYVELEECFSIMRTCPTMRALGYEAIPRRVVHIAETYRIWDEYVGGLLPKTAWLRPEFSRHLTVEQHIYIANKFLKNKFYAFSAYTKDIGHFILRLSDKKTETYSSQICNFYRSVALDHPCFVTETLKM